jgi:hypothetical protein
MAKNSFSNNNNNKDRQLSSHLALFPILANFTYIPPFVDLAHIRMAIFLKKKKKLARLYSTLPVYHEALVKAVTSNMAGASVIVRAMTRWLFISVP